VVLVVARHLNLRLCAEVEVQSFVKVTYEGIHHPAYADAC